MSGAGAQAGHETDRDEGRDPGRDASLRQLEQEMGVVVRRLKRIIGERANAVHHSLQPASYLILSYVEQNGPLRASDIVEIFDVDKGAISRQVQHLLDLGLLAKERHPDDGRAHLLSITPEAVRRMEDVAAHRRKWLDEQLGEWSTEELATFVSFLGRYNEALSLDADQVSPLT